MRLVDAEIVTGVLAVLVVLCEQLCRAFLNFPSYGRVEEIFNSSISRMGGTVVKVCLLLADALFPVPRIR